VTVKGGTVSGPRSCKMASALESIEVTRKLGRLRALAFVGLVGFSSGCLIDASLGTWPDPADESGPVATSASESAASEEASESEGVGADGDTGDGDGDTGDGGDGDGEGDGVCMIEATDTPCDTCLKHLCCAQLESCGGVSDCFCMLECLMSSDAVSCASQCLPGLIYIQLVQCRAVNCAPVCG
jgi:hypothetical protein